MNISFNKLKDIREDSDLSQTQMAEKLNVTREAYAQWELAINIIPLKHLCDFADYFNVSIDYVLGLSKHKDSKNIIKGLDLKVLGANMKKIRLSHKLSQENVAQMLEVTHPCIVRYEKGLITISISNLYKFCKNFKVSLSEVCGKTSIK